MKISHSFFSIIYGIHRWLFSGSIRKEKHVAVSIVMHALLIGFLVTVSGCPDKMQKLELIENVKIISIGQLDAIKSGSPSQSSPPPAKESSISLPEPKAKPPKPKTKPKTEKKIEKYSSDDFKKRLENKLKTSEEQRPGNEGQTPQTYGSPTGGTSIRTNIKENWYLALLKSKIENSWQRPSRVLMKGKGDLSLTVNFVLQKTGLANNISISESSGIAFVDLSALSAVKNASPFPPIPEKTSDKAIEISIDFMLSE